MLFTKQFIKSVSYPVTNCVNKTFNRKISTSSIRNEDLNMFTTTFKVVTFIVLSTIYLLKLIIFKKHLIELKKIKNNKQIR